MPRRLLLLVCLFLAGTRLLLAQAAPTAAQAGDLQVGAGYVRANPDYSPHQFNGFFVYGDGDLWKHFGAEAEFHRIAGVTISETTYEIGGRYRLPVGPFSPYLKVMGGRGSFNFGSSSQNGSYAMFAGGGGIEYRVLRKINFRVDYEYQRWGSFPPRGLQPSLVTIGAAYRFR